ncbi:MAG: putative sortase-like protein [Marmoricola sp.]|jgi:sortase (surface protein transpeptidase)|nr:putative sortase-like protein [Marmoricola sp.]
MRRVQLVSLVAAGVVVLGGCGDVQPAQQAATAPSTPSVAVPVPAATPTGVPAMARSRPRRLRIPAIGVDSSLMALGLKKDGTLETPPGPFPAGWFTGAPTPGELGPAIIVGHVRYVQPGVFEHLGDLKRNDQIRIARKDGTTAVFRVTKVEHFEKARFPTKKVYGNIDHPGLRLITCGGLVAGTNVFEENVVVFADLV